MASRCTWRIAVASEAAAGRMVNTASGLPCGGLPDAAPALRGSGAFAAALEDFFHCEEPCGGGIQFGDLAGGEAAPLLGVAALVMEEHGDLGKGEAACLGALEHGETVERGGVVDAAAAGANRVGEQAGALVEADGGGPQAGAFRDVADGHGSSNSNLT